MDTQAVLIDKHEKYDKYEKSWAMETSSASADRGSEEQASWLSGFLCGFLAATGADTQGAEAVSTLEARLERRLLALNIAETEALAEGVMRLVARLRLSPGPAVLLMRNLASPPASRTDARVAPMRQEPVKLRALELLMRGIERRIDRAAMREWQRESVDVWVYDAARWTLVSPSGDSVQLSLAESQLIRCLFSRRNEVVAREEILTMLNRPHLEAYSRNLDVTVSRLRKKVDEHCREKLPVISARGLGYAFSAPAMILS